MNEDKLLSIAVRKMVASARARNRTGVALPIGDRAIQAGIFSGENDARVAGK